MSSPAERRPWWSSPLPQLAKCAGRDASDGLCEKRTSRRLASEDRSGSAAAERWLCAAEIFLSAGRVESEAGSEVRALLETTGGNEGGKKCQTGGGRGRVRYVGGGGG